MNLYDLRELVSFTAMVETLRTKLNGTFIVHKNRWWECGVLDDCGQNYSDNTNLLYLKNSVSYIKYVKTLKKIITEPIWPEAGYYKQDNKVYSIQYTNHKIYKAGLHPSQINITRNNELCNLREVLHVLDMIYNKQYTYPTIETAVQDLLNSNNIVIPIDINLLVGAHPFINNPVVYYNNIVIGVIKENKVQLTKENENLTEYFQHIGVQIYA